MTYFIYHEMFEYLKCVFRSHQSKETDNA